MKENTKIKMALPTNAAKTKMTDTEVRKCTYRLLKNMHANQSLAGFAYTIDAVAMVYSNPKMMNGITKPGGLYNTIAAKYKKNDSMVKRAIRHLIEMLTDIGNTPTLSAVFGEDAISHRQYKPTFTTNCKFIIGIVNYFVYEEPNLSAEDTSEEEVQTNVNRKQKAYI